MWSYTKSESDWLEQKPPQFPVYPKNDGTTSLTDAEIRQAIERGHVMRAEFTRKAVVSACKSVSDMPERLGNWLRNGENTPHIAR